MTDSDQPKAGGTQMGGELNEIAEIRHYTGGEACQYKCGSIAEFVVVGRGAGGKVTFAGCRSCLNSAAIYPIDNGWVDERTDQVRHS